MNIEPYVERQTSLIAVREVCGWKLKVYSICATERVLDDVTMEAAIQHTTDNVGWPDVETKFGFITLHVGEQAVWLLVDLWVDDILRHFLFFAPLDAPDQFKSGPGDGTMACVWELAVFAHERNAWVKHVLSKPEQPDFEGYAADGFDITSCTAT